MAIQRLMSDEALLQELGHRITRLRLDRNLSQAQLAEQAGISKRTLERLEAGAAATQLPLFLRMLRQRQRDATGQERGLVLDMAWLNSLTAAWPVLQASP